MSISTPTHRAEPAELACQRHPDLFFAESPSDLEAAKELCQPCALRRPCLDQALLRREPWGVWGGEVCVDGVVVPRKRGRGRPRKEVLAA